MKSETVDKNLLFRAHYNPFRKSLFLILITVTLTALVISPAQGAFPPGRPEAPALPVWTLYKVDSPPYFDLMTDRSLRIRPVDKVPCTVYGGEKLYYACLNTTTGLWESEIVDSDPRVGAHAALAFNATSIPFISYYDGTNGRLKVAYKVGAIWTKMVVDTPVLMAVSGTEERQLSSVEKNPNMPEELATQVLGRPWREAELYLNIPDEAEAIVPDAGGVGKYTSITIDSLGRVHVSYYDEQNKDLKYAFWDTVNPWQVETVDAYADQGKVGLWTSIATDTSNRPHISYMSEKYDDLKYAFKKGSSWDIVTVDSTHNVGTRTSLVLRGNPTRYAYITYFDFSTNHLRFAVHDFTQPFDNWSVSNLGDESGVGLYSSIFLDHQDFLHVAFYDFADGDLKYARASASGGSWNIQTVVSGGNVGLYPSIVAFDKDHPGITFFNASTGKVQYAYREANSWKVKDVSEFSSDVGLSTSLAISGLDVPYISYMDDMLDYQKYAFPRGSAWYKNYLTQGIRAGAWSDIVMLDDFHPAIAFYDMTNKDLMYAKWSGLNWVFQDVDTTGNVGAYVSMDLDTSKSPHLSYYDTTNGDLIYTYWNPVTSHWITQTLDSNDDVGLFTSIVLSTDNRPYISYYHATGHKLKLAYKTPLNAWIISTIDSSADVGQFSSIALDSLGNPHISYYDATNQDLKYAYWNGVSWVIQVLDATGAVGMYTSLVINPLTDERHICYYDATNGDLKYAYWDGITWAFQVVDATGVVGLFCSIALNSAGQPGISYYDASFGDLKYASSYPLPPALVFLPLVIKAP